MTTNDFSRRRLLTGVPVALAAGYAPQLFGKDLKHGAALLETGERVSASACGAMPGETRSFLQAAVAGDAKSVEQFLAQDGSLLYARDEAGQSAYLLAAYAGREEVLKAMEVRGLVLDIHEAMAGGKGDRMRELLTTAPGLVRVTNAMGDTPLHSAALAGRAGMVDAAIQYGPNFAAQNPKRNNLTAAHIGLATGAENAAEQMAYAMVGNGLDPNVKTTDGNTILHSAAQKGYPRVMRLLVQKGADVSAKNAEALTALDIAAKNGRTQAAELLRNANLVPRDYYAKRFLYRREFQSLERDDTQGLPQDLVNTFVVFSHFGFEQVKKLFKACPDLLNTRAVFNELPVEAAAHMGRADIGEFYLERGAAYSLPTAIVFGSMADVKRMLTEDPQRIHERGAHTFPLLLFTAFGSAKLDVMEFLIAQGADVKEDLRGRTVLHTAASRGHMEMCRFLLEKGLDPRLKGTSFLGVSDAIESAEQGKHPDVAEMLRAWKKT
ncbi:MAG: ankyrin repeat domain-containing protein [Acidobacteria bacterium]|nr:ankyrin repeat domain-containing protein [Acidobacteriota bacterium]